MALGVFLLSYPNDFCFLFLSLLMFLFIECLCFFPLNTQAEGGG
jgi:hypothetical protein